MGPAPYLTEYFVKQETFVAQLMCDDPFEQMGKMKQAQADEKKLAENLKTVIAKAFRHHDSNADGVLNKEEADVSMDHFVERFVEFQCSSGLKQLDKAVAMTGKMMEDFDESDPDEKEMMEQMKRETAQKIQSQKTKLSE